MKIKTYIIALFVIGIGGTAFAGEVTGNGGVTPVKNPGTAASPCAFSGLEDEATLPDGTPGVIPGVVQSFGSHPGPGTGVSDDPANNNPSNFDNPASPGVNCNPS